MRIFPVILAGGASSRLWPASGLDKPKWDLRLFSGAGGGAEPRSLLQGAWRRARLLAPAEDCLVVTGPAQAALVRASLPEIPPGGVLVEPEPRDTAAAVAYAAGAILRALNGAPASDAVMLVLPGDHVIDPPERFAECAQAGARAAVDLNALVTFGIVARSPATAYGYIHRGAAVPSASPAPGAPQIFRVRQFREKPDRATAEKYLASGEYYWNGGIFLWRMTVLLGEFERQLAPHAAMARALGGCQPAEWEALARAHFPLLKKTSIDFGIMEHAQAVATVAADFAWDDIGSWSAVAAHMPRESANAAGPRTELIALDAKDNLVFAPGKRVALIGVEGLAVVESDGQILVCRLDRDQDVKKVSEEAARKGRGG